MFRPSHLPACPTAFAVALLGPTVLEPSRPLSASCLRASIFTAPGISPRPLSACESFTSSSPRPRCGVRATLSSSPTPSSPPSSPVVSSTASSAPAPTSVTSSLSSPGTGSAEMNGSIATTPCASVPSVGAAYVEVADGLSFSARLAQYASNALYPSTAATTLDGWFDSYIQAVSDSTHVSGDAREYTERAFTTLLELGRRHCAEPYDFQPYHPRVRAPFDYYKFGLEFATVLVNIRASVVRGQEHARRACEQIAAGENVVFLSNHQSEGDPYAIDVLLDQVAGMDRKFCEEIVFMAGDRVRDDPVVAPFSIGRNLLTVYSKKHINDVPELRSKKLRHNQRTMTAAARLFSEGGHCVWFAPSGGRDRRSAVSGRVEVSAFDADAVDMMRLTANKASRPTHFYPMSLLTYDMLPPPSNVGGAQVGEVRTCSFAPMHMYLSPEIDLNSIVFADLTDKRDRRRLQAMHIEDIVRKGYTAIGGDEH